MRRGLCGTDVSRDTGSPTSLSAASSDTPQDHADIGLGRRDPRSAKQGLRGPPKATVCRLLRRRDPSSRRATDAHTDGFPPSRLQMGSQATRLNAQSHNPNPSVRGTWELESTVFCQPRDAGRRDTSGCLLECSALRLYFGFLCPSTGAGLVQGVPLLDVPRPQPPGNSRAAPRPTLAIRSRSLLSAFLRSAESSRISLLRNLFWVLYPCRLSCGQKTAVSPARSLRYG